MRDDSYNSVIYNFCFKY